MNIMRKAGASIALTGSLLLAGGALAGPASAAPNQNQDGLVNVAVGAVTILQDVNIAAAVQAAVQACGVTVKNVALLATITDFTGNTTTVCRTDQGRVTFQQN